jgi:hypothetical protein
MQSRLVVAGLLALLVSLDARAQLLYGDFETLQVLGSPDALGNTNGYPKAPWQMITNTAFVPQVLYANWDPDGNAYCCDQLGSVPPIDGSHYLLLTPRTLSGIPAIESWLGLSAGTIANSIPPPASNLNCFQGVCGPTAGFAVRQTFAANAGDEIRFSFDFGNNRLAGYAAENESAIATLVGPTTSTVLVLSNSSGDGTPVTGPRGAANTGVYANGSNYTISYGNSYGFANSTGWTSRTMTVPETGDVTLGFALIDQYDTTSSNVLLLDAVQQIPFVPACNNGVDDDGDGLVDYPNDPGCRSASSTSENPQCQDGIDNDGDGKIDFDGGASANQGVALAAADPQCGAAWHNGEKPATGCGLGTELALVMPLLAFVASRRRRAN